MIRPVSESDQYTNIGALGVPDSQPLSDVVAPRRGPVYGSRFAVATDHPLASLAAMTVMQRGGNAADAAVAAAAVNVVTKPHRTHLGGDAFCLIWRRGQNTVDCLNAGGLAPKAATSDRFPNGIPTTGPLASSVPGLVDAMLEVHTTYGTRPLETVLEPAIRYASEGFPVSMRLAGAISMVPDFNEPWSSGLRNVFLKDGRTPYREGETLRQPDLAETLRRLIDDVMEEQREGFYRRETADRIDTAMKQMGGLIEKKDFEESLAVWDDPIMTSYGGCDVYEQALPSQGIILLEALNILENFPLAKWGLGSADAVHVMVEATKLAFADSRRYSADPTVVEVPLETLLSKDFARRRAAEIDMRRAGEPVAATLVHDTTEFVVADEDMAIAFIQSVFAPWGSRVLIPGTGVLMNSRLSGFDTTPGSPNLLAPGKRTIHTLNTFMALRNGELVCGGGTPGGDYQVQSNLQTLVAVLDWGLDLQSAIDMPRWVMINGNLAMESRFSSDVLDDLVARGHSVARLSDWDGNIARSQLIASVGGGGWAVASDLRGEGVPLGW
jgi:gamma-glutamyltranspeptidase / glutathione hydrolase